MTNSPDADISLAELTQGCQVYWKREPRDAMYRIAIQLVEMGWGNPADIADGLGVILLTWNQAAYRFGSFDFAELEEFLRRNQKVLASFRNRKIETFRAESDAVAVESLFFKALDALAYAKDKRKTPVGVAKALHTLAPSFFPIWDQKIAKGSRCNWSAFEQSPEKYIAFMKYTQTAVVSIEAQYAKNPADTGLPSAPSLAASLSQLAGRPKTVLKFLDEYFYAKYTRRWI